MSASSVLTPAQEAIRLVLVAEPYLPLESPLEKQFLAALAAACQADERGLFATANGTAPHPLTTFPGQRNVRVTLQHPVGSYRVDFYLMAFEGQPLVVECDGYTYHDGAGETQSAYDRTRDRFFTEAGLRFLRFTGREIRREPQACVAQTLRVLANTGRHR